MQELFLNILFTSFLSFLTNFCRQTIMPSSSLGSVINANISGTVGSLFPPTSQFQYLIYTAPHLIVPTFFIRFIVLLRATFKHVLLKAAATEQRYTIGKPNEYNFSYFLICAQSESVTLVLTQLETSCNTRVLQWSSILMENCTA